MNKQKKIKRRSDYNNIQSYDDELALVLALLGEEKKYEREFIKHFTDVYTRLCKLYKEEFPFYFKNGADGQKLNQLLISLLSNSGDFKTNISKALETIERETRKLENSRLMAWLTLDYVMTQEATARSLGVTLPAKPIGSNKLQEVITKPWCADNKTYLDRVKDATSTMDKHLKLVITQGIRRGWSQERMATIFRNITGTALYKAKRLIRTETMAVYSKVTKEIYLENGIEYVEIIGDAMCGGICLDYVGNAIPLKDAEIGDDLPPYHPNCACSFCAYTEYGDKSE